MADVNMPVGEPYNGTKGAGYGPVAGAGAAQGEPTRRKAHRTHHCLNFLLRLLTAMATAAALTTIYKSNQTVGGARARWNDFTAFKFFLVANAVVLTYSTLSALASLLGVCTPHGPLSFSPFAWLTFLMDFVSCHHLLPSVHANLLVPNVECCLPSDMKCIPTAACICSISHDGLFANIVLVFPVFKLSPVRMGMQWGCSGDAGCSIDMCGFV